MEIYQYFTAVSATVFFAFVIVLIRRDSILMGAAFRWLMLALAILSLGIYPKLADIIAQWFGVAYSPILPVILACLILMLKALIADIERAKTQVKLDRIAQKLAAVEMDLKCLKNKNKK